MDAEIGAGPVPQLAAEVLEAGRHGAVRRDAVSRDEHPVPPVAQRPHPEAELPAADLGHGPGQLLRRDAHLHLAEQRVHPARLTGEADAEQRAHRAASAVAADEVRRPHARAVVQLHHDAPVVLDQPGDGAPPPQHGAPRDGVLLEQPVADRLGMPRTYGWEVSRLSGGSGGLKTCAKLAPRGYVVPAASTSSARPRWSRTSTRAGVQPQGPHVGDRLPVALEDQHLDPAQPQLDGEHQARRAAPAMSTSTSTLPLLRDPGGDCAARPGSCGKPPSDVEPEVEGGAGVRACR